jgi:hypothetical protein
MESETWFIAYRCDSCLVEHVPADAPDSPQWGVFPMRDIDVTELVVPAAKVAIGFAS